MIYAVLILKSELAAQFEVKQSYEPTTPRTEAIEEILRITNRRIDDLLRALDVLEHETIFS